jgi:hemoglobin
LKSAALRVRLAAFALAACAPALAQVGPPPAPPGLYAALGELPGIERLVGDFIPRLKRHPRLAAHFRDVKAGPFQEALSEQICWLAGGPCTFQGRALRDMRADMRGVHADLKIDQADFNALVEVLQDAMDAQGIPFAQQNRLLALLAPMHREIVTVR